ncbi:MAG TPA: glycine oxidase ThiO [Vicinamibacterales bacterium]|nr:glycine oxidase ThiO [Vicinamibacterales bacterium]
MTIVIVGAGIIGTAVADALTLGGADVTVLDMRSPGLGASQASAGILAPYAEAEPHSPLLDLGVRSLSLYDAFVAGAAERSGRAIEYARTGTLQVALDEAHAATLQAESAWLREAGVDATWLDSREIGALEPAVSASSRGGLIIRSHGFVGVRSLVHALMHSARFGGATFESPVEAADVIVESDRVRISAGERSWTADAMVIAAGSWSNRLKIRGASLPAVRPIRGQLLHLRWNGADLPRRVIWGPDCYIVPWSDGSLLVGATVEDVGFDERSTVDGMRQLLDAASALLPSSARASIEAVRVGLRPASPDGLPIIGPMPSMPNVVLATGHYRNGILLAPLTAQIVSAYLLRLGA